MNTLFQVNFGDQNGGSITWMVMEGSEPSGEP